MLQNRSGQCTSFYNHGNIMLLVVHVILKKKLMKKQSSSVYFSKWWQLLFTGNITIYAGITRADGFEMSSLISKPTKWHVRPANSDQSKSACMHHISWTDWQISTRFARYNTGTWWRANLILVTLTYFSRSLWNLNCQIWAKRYLSACYLMDLWMECYQICKPI